MIDAKVICYREGRSFIILPKYLLGAKFSDFREATINIRNLLRSDFGHHFDKVCYFFGKKGRKKRKKIKIGHVCRH
jgi:hypothetical protein